MSESGGKTYRPWEPERYRHEAQSPAGKLPEGDLVFFLRDTVPRLDVQGLYASYEEETRGAPPFDPTMMVCLLLYAYCVGVFSSRKMALACERHLAFMAMGGAGAPGLPHHQRFPHAASGGLQGRVCAGGTPGVSSWAGAMGQRVDGWDENPGERVASQGHELRIYE
jgi:hypothetical protein